MDTKLDWEKLEKTHSMREQVMGQPVLTSVPHFNPKHISGSWQVTLVSMCHLDLGSDAMEHTLQGELGRSPEPEGTAEELFPAEAGGRGVQLRTDLAHHQDSGATRPPEAAHLQDKRKGDVEGGTLMSPERGQEKS